MKKLLAITFLFISIDTLSQSNEDYPLPDSATVVNFPWFDNNQFLLNYITERGYYGNPQARTECPPARYRIPVKIHIYRNDAGDLSSNLTEEQALDVFDRANTLFNNTNASIQFHLDEIVFKNEEKSRTGLSSFVEVVDFFSDEGTSGVMNIHFVDASSFIGGGYAITPFYPSFPNTRWNCYVETGENRSNPQIAATLSHELGHTLGLLHTHHPGRLISLAFNEENGTVSNGCYQEMQSRTEKNKIHRGCITTGGKLKCEINGDFLCDTAGDPGLSDEEDNNQVILKRVIPGSCQYENPGFGSDYTEDNMEENWTPPVNNIMSYSNFTCQDELTPMQVGQMWYFIEEDFPWEHESQFAGLNQAICQTGRTITFQNPPNEVGALAWNVQPEELVHSSTRSGTGTSAFIKAANGTNGGQIWVEWTSADNCNFFSSSTPAWVNEPNLTNATVNGGGSISVGASYSFSVQGDKLADHFEWVVPFGWQVTAYGNKRNATIRPMSNGQHTIYARAYTPCNDFSYVSTNVCVSGFGHSCSGYVDPGDPCANVDPNGAPCLPDDPHPHVIIGPELHELIIKLPGEEEYSSDYQSPSEKWEVKIFDLSGNEIHTFVTTRKEKQLTISDLPTNIYIVKVWNSRSSITKKVVIN